MGFGGKRFSQFSKFYDSTKLNEIIFKVCPENWIRSLDIAVDFVVTRRCDRICLERSRSHRIYCNTRRLNSFRVTLPILLVVIVRTYTTTIYIQTRWCVVVTYISKQAKTDDVGLQKHFSSKIRTLTITHNRVCVRVRVCKSLWFINSRTLDTDRR